MERRLGSSVESEQREGTFIYQEDSEVCKVVKKSKVLNHTYQRVQEETGEQNA